MMGQALKKTCGMYDAASENKPRDDEDRDVLKSLRDFRIEHIERALRLAGNDEERAADMLGITHAQLRRWMKDRENTR